MRLLLPLGPWALLLLGSAFRFPVILPIFVVSFPRRFGVTFYREEFW